MRIGRFILPHVYLLKYLHLLGQCIPEMAEMFFFFYPTEDRPMSINNFKISKPFDICKISCCLGIHPLGGLNLWHAAPK